MQNNVFSLSSVLGGMILAVFASMHPWSATGAIFGCFFFLAMPNTLSRIKKFLMTLVSWAVGYGTGVFFYGEGPPWTQKAMVVSILASALAAVVLTSMHTFIQNGSSLPPWFSALLDKIPFGTRKGDG